MYNYTLQLVVYSFFLPQSHFALLKLLIKKMYFLSHHVSSIQQTYIFQANYIIREDPRYAGLIPLSILIVSYLMASTVLNTSKACSCHTVRIYVSRSYN